MRDIGAGWTIDHEVDGKVVVGFATIHRLTLGAALVVAGFPVLLSVLGIILAPDWSLRNTALVTLPGGLIALWILFFTPLSEQIIFDRKKSSCSCTSSYRYRSTSRTFRFSDVSEVKVVWIEHKGHVEILVNGQRSVCLGNSIYKDDLEDLSESVRSWVLTEAVSARPPATT